MNRITPILLWAGGMVLSLIFFEDQLLPFIGCTFLLAARSIQLLHVEKAFLLVLFALLPFSLEYEILPGTNLNIPSEGIVFLLFFVTLFKLLPYLQIKYLLVKKQWIFWSAFFFLLSLFWGFLFSTMPLVSLKFLAINTLFVFVGLVLPYLCLIEKKVRVSELMLASLLGLVLVCLYAATNLMEYGVGRNVAATLSRPFFNDHTHFAATLLLVFPLALAARSSVSNPVGRTFLLGTAVLFGLYVIISFSRAAWLSALVMLGVYGLYYFKIKARYLIVLTAGGLLLLVLNAGSLQNMFRINKNDSNERGSSVGKQLKSVTNTTSDVSNIERLNRWKCALRMGAKEPMHGFGPGTYQFQYLPFQQKSDLSRISVNSPFYVKEGWGGTAHSEYLLSFSESGYPGLVGWIFLIIAVLTTGHSILKKSQDKNDRFLSLMILLGLIGYFIHALFNNFLNSASLALFFWLMIGILAYTNNKNLLHADPESQK